MTREVNMTQKKFPLAEKVQAAGAFEENSVLICAPTATGKTHVGMDITIYYAQRKPKGMVNTYLVPYKALASEVVERFRDRCAEADLNLTVKISTGDYYDPYLDLTTTDILVATYEKFDSLLRDEKEFRPYVVVADEIHLLGDEHRGPRVEGLITRMLDLPQRPLFFPLSATVGNPEELARWMQIKPLIGSDEDRAVQLELHREFTADKNSLVEHLAQETLKGRGQALVFCETRKKTERQADRLASKVAKTLSDQEREKLSQLAQQVVETGSGSAHLQRLIEQGVCYHHAGLDREVRLLVEQGYRERNIKAIACTPTLAGGVNLPARLVIVKDATRGANFRGRYRRIYLSAGEVLQMLGRAGRPGLDPYGYGVVLFTEGDRDRPEAEALWESISQKVSEHVESQMERRFNYLMEFILGCINLNSPCTLQTIVDVIRQTFWYFQKKPDLSTQAGNILEELLDEWEATRRIGPGFGLGQLVVSFGRITAKVENRESGGIYEVKLSSTDYSCDCHGFRYHYRGAPCKHLAFLFRELLLGERSKDDEIYQVASQLFIDRFGEKISVLTRVREALRRLHRWRFIKQVDSDQYEITKPGKVALASYLDLFLAHDISMRVLMDPQELDDVARLLRWATRDTVGLDESPDFWVDLLHKWMNEAHRDEIEQAVGYYPDFLNFRDELNRILFTYYRFASLYQRMGLRDTTKLLMRRLRYGVHPELLPLAVLNLPDIGRARLRAIYQKGHTNLWELVKASPDRLASRAFPRKIVESGIAIAHSQLRAIEEAVDMEKRAPGPIEERRRHLLARLSETLAISWVDIDDYLLPEIARRYGLPELTRVLDSG